MRFRTWQASLPILVMALGAGCEHPTEPAPESEVITVDSLNRMRRVASLPVSGSVLAFVAFSQDGGQLLARDRTGEVLGWNTEGWSRSTIRGGFLTQTDFDTATVNLFPAMAVSPDGRTVATVTSLAGEVRLWQLGGGELFAFSHGSQVYSLVFSPDGGLVAAGGLSRKVLVHEVTTGRLVADLRCDREFAGVLAFSPGGRMLVAGYERPGNLMKAWSTSTWQETSTFRPMAERGEYHDILFTPDGRYLVLAGINPNEPVGIEILDAGTFQLVQRFNGRESGLKPALSPDGALLASTWSGADLWGMANHNLVRSLGAANHGLGVAFSPDGKLWLFRWRGRASRSGASRLSEPPALLTVIPSRVYRMTINIVRR
jgi:WD40 repeat protein